MIRDQLIRLMLRMLQPPPPPPSADYKVVLDESRRLLDRQEKGLDEFRTRGSGLLAVAAVVAGLLGTTTVKAHHSSWLAYAGLGLFGLTALVAIYVLAPREFTFSHTLDGFVDDLDIGKPTNAVERDMALHLQEFREANDCKIKRIARAYTLGCVLLAAQVLAWGGGLVLNGASVAENPASQSPATTAAKVAGGAAGPGSASVGTQPSSPSGTSVPTSRTGTP